MYQQLPISKNTAIKQLVFSHLWIAISIYFRTNHIEGISKENIPLYKGRDNNRVLYISGVALQLSKSQNRPSIHVANAIVSHLSAKCIKYFNIQIVSPGWIHLELSDQLLATWLQNLVFKEVGEWESSRHASPNPLSGAIPQANSQFTAQYAHARCCTLLRLACQERLIKLSQPEPGTAFWTTTGCNQIPWLNCDQMRDHHPASRRLIAELIQVVDLEYSDSRDERKWEKAALNLSEAFQNFWSECRIWGDVKTTNPELAQARLGLVLATQSVLRFLLEDKLGIFALQEL
ncbi:MAG: DALR anticodon-binding domain-containing protein [Rhizonema sp. PD37]|nr:DALR anticodon-binding domain-containing protein [Rhizonema sp. PD37]